MVVGRKEFPAEPEITERKSKSDYEPPSALPSKDGKKVCPVSPSGCNSGSDGNITPTSESPAGDDKIAEKVLKKLENHNLAWSWANKYDKRAKEDFKIAIKLAIAEMHKADNAAVLALLDAKIAEYDMICVKCNFDGKECKARKNCQNGIVFNVLRELRDSIAGKAVMEALERDANAPRKVG
jgi:hypothetical protein